MISLDNEQRVSYSDSIYLIVMHYLGRFYQLVFHAAEPSELAVGWNSR